MTLRLVLLLIMSSVMAFAQAQNRAIWATIWSINTPAKVDKLLQQAHVDGFNQIFLQVRYRADAVYIPNRKDSSFANPESRSYILNGSAFDPLDYALNSKYRKSMQIHAWVPIFVVTPHDLSKIDSKHIYYQHRDWITKDLRGNTMPYNVHEGAFLDPGIPQVQQYLLNILSDIVMNYPIDGLQLDYIRYPDSIYGYNPLALDEFKKTSDINFSQWKQQQVNSFVEKVYIQLKEINPKLCISAAVFANQKKATNSLSQNWKHWADKGYIDQLYVMAYNTSSVSFEQSMNRITNVDNQKVTIVLRAWKDKKTYSVHQINDKIKITKKFGFTNFGFYSYSGMVDNGYWGHIKY